MNAPSEEQQKIIDFISQGYNVIVDACAGSGKSTTILSVAKQCYDKRILQLTYNSTLRMEIKEKIEKIGLENITVHTFHSLAVRFYLENAHNDTVLRQIIHFNTPPRTPIPKYNIIVLDEAQDMTPLYFHFMLKFSKDMDSPFLLLILGDYMQGLYEFKGSDIRFLTLGDCIWNVHPLLTTKEFKKCTLKMSYRITNQIADFVNKAMLGEERLLACKEGPPVTYIRRAHHQASAIIINQILNLFESGVTASDIFVLANSVKKIDSDIRKIENALAERNIPCFVPMNEIEKMDDRVIEGKVVFTTFNSVKGRQRKYVFVVGFDQSYFNWIARDLPKNICPNTLYVACTRSTEGLTVIEKGDRAEDHPLSFLRMSHHDMINSPFVDFKGIPRLIFHESSRISSEKIMVRKTTPTELIRFIDENVLDAITPIIEKIFVNISDEYGLQQIQMNTVIKTKRGFYEDISDLNGIAIPCIFYDYINKYKVIDNDIDLDTTSVLCEMIHQQIDQIHPNKHLYLRKIVQNMSDDCDTIREYLYKANICVSLNEKIYSKLKQIDEDEYTWLDDDLVNICIDRMNRVIGRELDDKTSFEELIIDSSDDDSHYRIDRILSGKIGADNTLYRFSARVDLLTETSCWELKCTSQITIDHFLQVAIYAWIWSLTNDEERDFKIFNIKTGEVWILKSSQEDLNFIIIQLLRGKYGKIDKKTDQQFISDCLKCYPDYFQ